MGEGRGKRRGEGRGEGREGGDEPAAHSEDWRAWAAVRSALVQLAVRHWRAVDWKDEEVQTQVRFVLGDEENEVR